MVLAVDFDPWFESWQVEKLLFLTKKEFSNFKFKFTYEVELIQVVVEVISALDWIYQLLTTGFTKKAGVRYTKTFCVTAKISN